MLRVVLLRREAIEYAIHHRYRKEKHTHTDIKTTCSAVRGLQYSCFIQNIKDVSLVTPREVSRVSRVCVCVCEREATLVPNHTQEKSGEGRSVLKERAAEGSSSI